jgi:hypothetical protein
MRREEMKYSLTAYGKKFRRSGLASLVALPLVAAATLWTALEVSANHPVLVEGNNCANGAPGTTVVPPGTCGDYDGDGLIGTAEDTDNATDRVFGTINGALGAANGGANQNGRVTIVTSGRFAEVVNITAANGNVTLEAAPGVEANIDAVLAGDAGNAARQGAPGIIISAPADRFVTLRNIVSRNWTQGILVTGDSRVLIDHCRVENNVDYGILVQNNAKVTVTNCQVTATGFRVGATGSAPSGPSPVITPNPGIGIEFEGNSSGVVADSTVSGSFAAGISNSTANKRAVTLADVITFDNNPNVDGIKAK